jgi:mannose-6-phosphate isomerase-like protein (cupin superfamily)
MNKIIMEQESTMELIDIINMKNRNGSKLFKNIPLLTDQVMAATLLMEPGTEQPGHAHENYDELHYIVKGKGRITIENDARNIEAGMLLLVPMSKTHFFQTGDEGLLVLSFSAVGDCNQK